MRERGQSTEESSGAKGKERRAMAVSCLRFCFFFLFLEPAAAAVSAAARAPTRRRSRPACHGLMNEAKRSMEAEGADPRRA